MITEATTRHLSAIDILDDGLKARNLSELSSLYRRIAESFSALGAVLWEVTPDSDVKTRTGELFVNSAWLPTEYRFPTQDLPLDGTRVGDVAATGRSMNLANVQVDEGRFHNHPFIVENDLGPVLLVPLVLYKESRAVFALFRQLDQPPFDEEELKLLEQVLAVLPTIHHAVCDRISLDTIRRIDELIRDADHREASRPIPREAKKKLLQDICDEIGRTFNCMEATIVLSEKERMSSSFDVWATTWPSDIIRMKKTSYGPRAEEGLTGWVLEHGRPLRMFDLRHFKRDRTKLRRRYPGVRWRDPGDLLRTASKFLNVTFDDLPPLGYLGVPIMAGAETVGAVRCCVVKSSRNYFGALDEELLTSIATRIGYSWQIWIERRRERHENEFWTKLVESIHQANMLLQSEVLASGPLSEKAIYERALEGLDRAFGRKLIMDVAFRNETGLLLEPFVWSGDGWDDFVTGTEIKRCEYSFALSEDRLSSVGWQVVKNKETVVLDDVSAEGAYFPLFPDVKKMICAPIRLDDFVYGVLTVRSQQRGGFSEQARIAVDLLARQFGLYHYLAESIRKLRETESHLRGEIDYQSQIYQDLSHQLKGPVFQAYARAQRALDSSSYPVADLRAIRGLCRKVKQVTQSMGLLSDLAAKRQVRLRHKVTADIDSLRKLLVEAKKDNQLLVDPERNIRFELDDDTLNLAALYRVDVDYDLLEQALNNLLDNAGKYSYPNTAVRIYGGETKKGEFYIAVENEGLVIRGSEINKCTQREWRGEEAKSAAGEGSGIGLWMVDNIMKAHDGRLHIMASVKNKTVIRLMFPIRDKKAQKMRIVVVEDDQLQVETLGNDLSSAFSNVEIWKLATEHDFRSGLDQIVEWKPDLVLVDVMLPWQRPTKTPIPPPEDVENGGYQLAGLRCARDLNRKRVDVPIILYSILTEEDLAAKADEMDLRVTHVSKEESNLPLINRIKSVCSLRK